MGRELFLPWSLQQLRPILHPPRLSPGSFTVLAWRISPNANSHNPSSARRHNRPDQPPPYMWHPRSLVVRCALCYQPPVERCPSRLRGARGAPPDYAREEPLRTQTHRRRAPETHTQTPQAPQTQMPQALDSASDATSPQTQPHTPEPPKLSLTQRAPL